MYQETDRSYELYKRRDRAWYDRHDAYTSEYVTDNSCELRQYDDATYERN